MPHCPSNGYEAIASDYILIRSDTGAEVVRTWAAELPDNARILDLGCGSGDPVTALLIEQGLDVFAIDASPTMIEAFKARFPDVPVACEAVEDSAFFNQTYDAIVAVGLMFLLDEATQLSLISKVSKHLNKNGKFLFTAPKERCEWQDNLTGQRSRSLGAKAYRAYLMDVGFVEIKDYVDEGGNCYYASVKQ